MLGAPPVVADATVTNCTQATLTSAIAAGGVVTLDCGAPTTVHVTTTLNITTDTELVGVGDVTLDGGGTTRVLFVQLGVALTLRNLTIANGFDANLGGGVASQGALTVEDSAFSGNTTNALGGAIASASDDDVTLTNTTFSGNSAGSGGAVAVVSVINPTPPGTVFAVTNCVFSNNQAGGESAQGGAIFSAGFPLEITDSSFDSNRAVSTTTGTGGAVFATGLSLTVTNSSFRNNSAVSNSVSPANATSVGGAIFNGSAMLVISDSTFSANSAEATSVGDNLAASSDGGAVFSGSNDVSITGSTFNDNHATARAAGNTGATASSDGGAIFNGSNALTISNSTLSANSADANADSPNASSFGGALFNGSTALTLLNDTISDNRASAGGSFAEGEAIFNGSSTTSVANTIVAGSGNAACFGVVPAPPSSHNLASDMSCNFTAAGDQQNVTAAMLKLGPLQDNGGPTPTMLPGAGSIAIDAGDDTICAAPPVNSLDQRGHARPFGTHCDVGAVEVGPANAQVRGIAVLRQSCGAQSATGFCLTWLIQFKVSEGSSAGITVTAVVDLPGGGQQQLSGVTDKAGGVKFSTPVDVYGTYTLTVTSASVGATPVPLSGPLTRSIAIGGRFR
jgi:hypothetical protein